MSFCCYASDGDVADVTNEQWRVAAKQHRCCECGTKIESGTLYQYTTMLYDRHWYDYKTCEKCADLREALDEVTCVQYEGLADAFTDWLTHGQHTVMKVRAGSHAARLAPSYFLEEEED